MRFLYIFPHPDDESFGPVAGMHRQLQNGHEVFLYTLTRGGATRTRFRLGLSVEEMGLVRLAEMEAVARTAGLSGMKVDDMPDAGLKELDPRRIEDAVRAEILRIRPDIVVTYPVHGVSGFHDHLVTHAVVKRVWLELRDAGESWLKRLAFITIPDDETAGFYKGTFRFKQSEPALIDCIMQLSTAETDMMLRCLECYGTYQQTIEESRVIERIGDKLYYEFFMENFDPPVGDIEAGLAG